MSAPTTAAWLETRLRQARELDRIGRPAQAEASWAAILQAVPGQTEASSRLAQSALDRGDAARAVELLAPAVAAAPADAAIALDLACAHLAAQQPSQAIATLESALARTPGFYDGWLLLGEVREVEGDAQGALKAWYQAVTRAQRAGFWTGQDTTPPHRLDAVVHAIATVRDGRRKLFYGAYDAIRQRHGPAELRRVDRALAGYLGDLDATPPDARQRPRFFYFPDLPATPYFDPMLQPWAGQLRDAFPAIRDEALRALAEDGGFEPFVALKPGDRMEEFVAGNGPAPAWDALFFYRHGRRYDSTHARCPQTSAVLEGIELCRIADEAPEICFSVLAPGSTILPHFGVTNTRAVMHLPLVAPPDCALNIVGIGEHRWREGELMLFDDTYGHEAWNRSQQTRVILLMDCWNPHLTPVEKLAIQSLIETIGAPYRDPPQ